MDAYYFSEMAFHPAWEAGGNQLRNDIPSRLFDPVVGHGLLNRFLDEYALCDELGLHIMLNEHHSTATCTDVACTLPLAILARETRKARLLALGMPIANRSDPVRVAEEFAFADVISGGRVEMGLVKGGPTEVFPANTNPVLLNERFWEAHDLIVKALTTHDGPFRWEGKHYQYRLVNVWPRCYQAPHPPIWMPVASAPSATQVAQHGYVVACLNTGFTQTRAVFDTYRRAATAAGHPADISRLAYMALVGVGDTAEEGYRRGAMLLEYIRTQSRRAPQYVNPLGMTPSAVNAEILQQGGKVKLQPIFGRDGRLLDRNELSVQAMIDAGTMFAGTPDMVFEQIRDFHTYVGGFGHLLAMAQGAWLSHEDTVENIKLFAREVLPRLAELVGVEASGVELASA
jgi:alkanesulfonate monooxygenase SsuD/methylene tetrahydromethanopterin reductase-like flavin-dependent oxidoreductase (luciferase family)